MSTITPRDFTLSYPFASVKHAVNKCSIVSGFTIGNKNETFGTWQINSVSFLKLIQLNIQVKSISENETNIIISSPSTIQTPSDSTIINEKFELFINLMSKVLEGKELTDDVISDAKPNKGCSVLILILILAGCGIAIFSCKPKAVAPIPAISMNNLKTIVYDAMVTDSMAGTFLTGFEYTLPDGTTKDSSVWPVIQKGTFTIIALNHRIFTYQIKSGLNLHFSAIADGSQYISVKILCNGAVLGQKDLNWNDKSTTALICTVP